MLLLKSLLKYHKRQTELLSATFSAIWKREMALLESSMKFEERIKEINRRIQILERSLNGGHFAVWYQFEESQREFVRIHDFLARRKAPTVANESNLDEDINDAKQKDLENMQKKVQDIVEKIQSHIRPRKSRFGISRPILPLLGELFPALKDPGLRTKDEAYRVNILHSILGEFKKMSPPSHLSSLMNELDSYVDAELQRNSIEADPSVRANIQVIRKPSGIILAVLFGPKTCYAIQTHYHPSAGDSYGLLPILFTTPISVGQALTTNEFLVARQAIASRGDSYKYAKWDGEPSAPTDIYLVEKPAGDNAFMLATILGPKLELDVVKTLPRTDRLIKDELSYKDPWLAESGWLNYGMQDMKCNKDDFNDYGHQIFVGPRVDSPA
ncbi:hypothetical protein MSAN_01377900 [Mycena sanguinolenta]|uniref:Uncharacterized protein n=1 Tax=Mycena sanguinolenta TaxID=230812 RepID=A0A8H7D0X2_9AGAR|nr:hypothetical protein MSAN_01377900 [Mycena sanguinolenta]